MKLVSSLIAKRCMECLEAFASGKIVLRMKQMCFGQYLEEKSSKITDFIFGKKVISSFIVNVGQIFHFYAENALKMRILPKDADPHPCILSDALLWGKKCQRESVENFQVWRISNTTSFSNSISLGFHRIALKLDRILDQCSISKICLIFFFFFEF